MIDNSDKQKQAEYIKRLNKHRHIIYALLMVVSAITIILFTWFITKYCKAIYADDVVKREKYQTLSRNIHLICDSIIIIIQVIMMFKIKCSNWLKFNGTQIDYGRELCFVIVIQITTIFLVLIMFSLIDRHWESLENYWKNNPITYSLYGSLLTILNKVIPTLA